MQHGQDGRATLADTEFLAPDESVARMNRPGTFGQRERRSRVAVCVLAVAIAVPLWTSGCATSQMATLRSVPKSPLAETLKLTSSEGPQASTRTKQFLRVHGLKEGFDQDPRELLAKVQAIVQAEPSADKMYALAELNYLAAKTAEKQDTRLALELYEASVLHAYEYLFDPRFRPTRNPYDPHFRSACDLYNGALEAGLRLICRDDGLKDGSTHTICTAGGIWDITCELRGGHWGPQDIERFEFVSDYEIKGLKNQYQTYGLGVPLIAVRRDGHDQTPLSRYYPPGLAFPVTALLRPVADVRPAAPGSAPRRHGVLELYDPLTTTDVPVAGMLVPLESDLTTPLAYFLSNPKFGRLGTIGLLNPEKLLEQFDSGRPDAMTGLFMVQAYEPGKIPVVMVHGLWSSPMTWIEMFNDLRSLPEIREHYQFWFYLYPTAEPFWVSAARLRKDLAETRQMLDPQHREPALDQMALVGHSMGGLLSRLQTIDSRDRFWRLVSDQPFDRVKASPEVRRQLAATIFFRPNPSIRRVVTIATPHRGSGASNFTTQWLLSKLVDLPGMLVRSQEALFLRQPRADPRRYALKDSHERRLAFAARSVLPGDAVGRDGALGEVSQHRRHAAQVGPVSARWWPAATGWSTTTVRTSRTPQARSRSRPTTRRSSRTRWPCWKSAAFCWSTLPNCETGPDRPVPRCRRLRGNTPRRCDDISRFGVRCGSVIYIMTSGDLP